MLQKSIIELDNLLGFIDPSIKKQMIEGCLNPGMTFGSSEITKGDLRLILCEKDDTSNEDNCKSHTQLLITNIKYLNKLMKPMNVSKEDMKKIKERRRRLINRGYAAINKTLML